MKRENKMFIKNNLKLEVTNKSLLRYPGGKTRAIKTIVPHFPKNITEMCSPFFGGGSIEIFMAAKGIKVYGYDVFKPLVEFWQILNSKPKELTNEVKQHFPLLRDDFYQLQKDQEMLPTKLKRAAAFYVLNRSSFSGSTLSGGMSPTHPRFNEASINRINDFNNNNFRVNRLDFEKSIINHSDIFAYLDPPYLIKLALYGKGGDTHKGFDHSKLKEILSARDNWIMSYNDCQEIRNMYSEYKIIIPTWKYGMSKNKSSNEILIFSKDL